MKANMPSHPTPELAQDNLSRAKTFLLGFCGTWLIPSVTHEYCLVVMKAYEAAKAKLEGNFDGA